MSTALAVFGEPRRYKESGIQYAIEVFWPCLFHNYRAAKRGAAKMPSDWQPDILGRNPNDITKWLIIEVKGYPPANSKPEAVKQVVGYGRRFREAHPEWTAKLIVMGPWATKRHEQGHYLDWEIYEKQEVGLVSLENVRASVLALAQKCLLWRMQDPLRGHSAYYGGLGRCVDADLCSFDDLGRVAKAWKFDKEPESSIA